MLEIPPMFRAEGAPLPPFKYSEASVMPAGQDLASVVGGHTMTGYPVAAEPERSGRWTIAILAVAALIGIGAAVAFQLEPSAGELAVSEASADDRAPVAQPALQPQSEPAAAPPVVAATDVKPTFPAAAPQPEEAPPPTAPPPTANRPAANPPAAVPPAGGDSKDAPSGKDVPDAPDAGESPRTPVRPPATERRPETGGTGQPAVPVMAPARAPRKVEPGYLRVHTTPWAWAIVGNDKQDTPAARFKLAPGHYTVRLKFPTLGITETHHVTVESQKTFTLNINKEEE